MVNYGYSVNAIKTFTLGEFVCRVHAVSFLIALERYEAAIKEVSMAPFAKPEDKEDTVRSIKKERDVAKREYNNLVVDW